MCFYSRLSKSAQELQNRFKAKFEDLESFQTGAYNGFQYPKTPVITNKEPNKIKCYNWGLIPYWAKDNSIQRYTLNARIETIHEKPAYKNVANNRCLILSDGFYEWQWLDKKRKQKYELTLQDDEPFAFAGLWSEWLNNSTGDLQYTYTIITMEANELMSKIHNTKKRMPVIVSAENEQNWLRGQELKIQNDRLIATKI